MTSSTIAAQENCGICRSGCAIENNAPAGGLKLPVSHIGDRACNQRSDQRRQDFRKPRHDGEHDENNGHARSGPDVGAECLHQFDAEPQEYSRHHRHHDRHRNRLHGAPHQPRKSEQQHQHPGNERRPDHLLEAQMRRAPARPAPPPDIVQKKTSGCRYSSVKTSVTMPLTRRRGEHPGCKIGLAQPRARADGKDDGDRRGRGKQKRHDRRRDMDQRKIRQRIAQWPERVVPAAGASPARDARLIHALIFDISESDTSKFA